MFHHIRLDNGPRWTETLSFLTLLVCGLVAIVLPQQLFAETLQSCEFTVCRNLLLWFTNKGKTLFQLTFYK